MKNMFYKYIGQVGRVGERWRFGSMWMGGGSRGARGEQHLQGSMRGELGREILNNILAPAIGWRSRSSFFFCNSTLKLHLGVLNPKLGHMKTCKKNP